MKIKFVDDAVIANASRGRKSSYPWAEFIEELYKHPNKWAEFPIQIGTATTAYRIEEQYANIKVLCTGGNQLSNSHPDKKLWTVYLKFEPPIVEEELF